jgi:hypothetical protein
MKLLLFVAGIFISNLTFAQKSETRNSESGSQKIFFGELGGPGVIFSINLDSRFTKSNTGFGGRAGLGFLTRSEGAIISSGGSSTFTRYRQRSVVTIPLQLNYVFGKANSSHLLEVGAGATFFGKKLSLYEFYQGDFNSSINEPESAVVGTASFMYRKIAKNGGFFWHGGFTPFFVDGYIQPMVGIGIGYGF